MTLSKTPRAAHPARAGGDPQNLELLGGGLDEKSSRMAMSAQRRRFDDLRLRHLARRLHALGERPLLEFLKEALSGADLGERLEVYGALDPEIISALGGSALPSILTAIDGGHA